MRLECSCGKTLTVADNLAGKKVRCPRCQETIRVPDAEDEILGEAVDDVPPPAETRKRSRSETDENDNGDDRPREKKKKPKPAPSFVGQYGLYLALGGGGLVVLTAVILGLIMLSGGGGNKGPVVQNKDKDGTQKDKNTDKVGPDGGPDKKLPFLDKKKQVGPKLEWNTEIVSKNGGTITFELTSQGPFAVLLVNEKAYKALLANQKFQKADVLLDADSKVQKMEKTVTIPPGSSWFIIENQAAMNVEFHLQCFAGK